MSIEYGFFNSIEGDRVYDADQISNIYEGLFTNGVIKGLGGEMYVCPGGGMTVRVMTGKCIIENKWLKIGSDLDCTLTLTGGESQDRIDLIVACLLEKERKMEIRVIKGTAAASPVEPKVGLPHVKLARINVLAGVSELVEDDILDAREYVSVDNLLNNSKRYVSRSSIYTATAPDSLSFSFAQSVGETVVDVLDINGNKVVQIFAGIEGVVVPKSGGGYLGVKLLLPQDLGVIPETAMISHDRTAEIEFITQTDNLGRLELVFSNQTSSDVPLERLNISYIIPNTSETIGY